MKKEHLAYILALFVGIAFVSVSLLVIISMGKSKPIRWKLKLGAILLTLTGACTTSSCVTPMCYDPVEENQIFNLDIPADSMGVRHINIAQNPVLTGNVYASRFNEYCFQIKDSSNTTELQLDDIIPADGLFDEYEEDFQIPLDTLLQNGKYFLHIYNGAKVNLSSNQNAEEVFPLQLVNSKRSQQ